MNSAIQSWSVICLALTALLGLMVGLSACRRRGILAAEPARKLLHIGMGLIALSFPWLFDRAWPVLLLAAAATLVLMAARSLAPLRACLGSALHDVERASLGEFYFALAVVLLFLLANGEKLLFCVPILLLTLADPAAALVGMRWGRRRIPGVESKSVQGSLAFFGVAFAILYLSLLLATGWGIAGSLLLCLVVAPGVTLIEAVAGRGLDNLWIPLGSFGLLRMLAF